MSESISAPPDDILSQIRYKPSGLNPVEARIATAILEDPRRIVRESITAFSRRTSVSAGSVVRFANLLGLAGYRDLKLTLAHATAQEGRGTPTQPPGSRFRSYMDEQVRATLFAAEEIDPMAIEKAASVVARARCIDITATGSSLVVAQGMLFSLTLLGLHVRFMPDAAEQAAAAAFLGPGDCLLAISFSGRTRAIVDAASRASQSGATVITLTCNARSPLLRHTRIALVADAHKGKFKAEWPLRTAMASVARSFCLYAADQLTEEELGSRRATWTSGRFGLRYEDSKHNTTSVRRVHSLDGLKGPKQDVTEAPSSSFSLVAPSRRAIPVF
ncbi:MAG TPA: MurR/RpiR family transcriptional regulator [Dehalococcoidia bacterium]|nr:MurR/RpiR family transcriptional regulator [Dehalococcoidia bacterium]